MKYIKLFLIVFFAFTISISAYHEAPVDITTMNVYEINESIDKGYLTYELLFNLYLDRIDAYDKDHKAIISINKNAIEEAKKCDIEFKKNGRTNPLWCMPLIAKDNIDVVGLPTTAGSKALGDSYPNEDAYVIKKLKEKGMIVLAKSNMSEFAFSADNSLSYYGMVKNAYNTDYSSYGSSGGSAVSVALNYSLFALGTDTNSSLRAPASASSVIGFRSTLGLVDTSGIIAYDITRDVVGPITRTVDENALIMSALTGDNYNDFDKSGLKGKNIVVLDQFIYGTPILYGGAKVYSEIKNLFEAEVKKLEEKGANIIHLNDFYKSSYHEIGNSTMAGWTMCYAFNKYIKNTSSKIKNFEQLAYSSGLTYSLSSYLNKCSISISHVNDLAAKKKSYQEYVDSIIEKYNVDAFIYPTNGNKLSKVNSTDSRIYSSKVAPILGLPAVSVPLGFDKDGFPYGIEFMGAKNSDKKLYDIIYAYEEQNYKYKLPSIAPALYKVSESVEELKALYENDEKYDKDALATKELEELKLEITNFYADYDNIENKESEASRLLNEYNTLKEEYLKQLEEIKIIKRNKKIAKTCLVVVIILIIVILIIQKDKKNKKKNYKKSR